MWHTKPFYFTNTTICEQQKWRNPSSISFYFFLFIERSIRVYSVFLLWWEQNFPTFPDNWWTIVVRAFLRLRRYVHRYNYLYPGKLYHINNRFPLPESSSKKWQFHQLRVIFFLYFVFFRTWGVIIIIMPIHSCPILILRKSPIVPASIDFDFFFSRSSDVDGACPVRREEVKWSAWRHTDRWRWTK